MKAGRGRQLLHQHAELLKLLLLEKRTEVESDRLGKIQFTFARGGDESEVSQKQVGTAHVAPVKISFKLGDAPGEALGIEGRHAVKAPTQEDGVKEVAGPLVPIAIAGHDFLSELCSVRAVVTDKEEADRASDNR